MNLASWLVLVLIAAAVFFALRSCWKSSRFGGCGCGCGSGGGGCGGCRGCSLETGGAERSCPPDKADEG